MEEMLQVIDRRRLLVPVPWWAAEIQGTVLGLLPNPPLTRDQVTLLRSDNVVSEEAKRETRTLDGLGIEPQSTAAILPGYLWRYRAAGQFTRRSEA
jgi:NADH dehydrogenase